MNIFISSDHRGVEAKKAIINYLESNDLLVTDVGLPNYDLDDYPDFAFKVGEEVKKNENSLGILICGNGIGMSIAANKVKGIRAVRATDSDDAFKGKNHNGANVLCVGSNLDINLINEIIDTFIATKSATEDRFSRRINKIINYENGTYDEL